MNVLVWNEFGDKPWERKQYPDGLHAVIRDFLAEDKTLRVTTATLDDEGCGLKKETLEKTDVLVYWAHCRHDELPDEAAETVADCVRRGLGVVFLHSAHKSKPFMKLTGGSGSLKWREAGERERIWVTDPAHPIAAGLPECFTVEPEEMYGEYFDIPKPDSVVFTGWFEGGNVFRSGVTFTRGYGRIFYFQPGHETYPTFRNPYVQRVIRNAVQWTARTDRLDSLCCPNEKEPHETISEKKPCD